MVFVFNIQITGITSTPIWRKLAVPSNDTFEQFHRTIQTAFGWTNSHLYEFRDKERKSLFQIGLPSKDDAFWGKQVKDARKVKLCDIIPQTANKLIYIYNFRQNWIHEIKLEDIQELDISHAICVGSRGQCPSGEYGNVWGYNEMRSGIWDDDF